MRIPIFSSTDNDWNDASDSVCVIYWPTTIVSQISVHRVPLYLIVESITFSNVQAKDLAERVLGDVDFRELLAEVRERLFRIGNAWIVECDA